MSNKPVNPDDFFFNAEYRLSTSFAAALTLMEAQNAARHVPTEWNAYYVVTSDGEAFADDVIGMVKPGPR